MAAPLPQSAFGISYTDFAYQRLAMDYDPIEVRRRLFYPSRLDEYQRFVAYADIQPTETVLDFACGTGVVGLLACDVLGAGKKHQVDFVDGSEAKLDVLAHELKARSTRNTNLQGLLHWVRDLRKPEMAAILKNAAGKPNGWNVVFAFLFLDQFTDDTKPLMIKHLREYVAPGGRLVLDWPVPSPSRGLWQVNASEQCVFGWRETVKQALHGCFGMWGMGTRLLHPSFIRMASWFTSNEAQRVMEAAIQVAGGTLQASTISPDPNTTTEDISGDLMQRAWATPTLPNQTLPVNIDIERRKDVQAREAIAPQHPGVGGVVSRRVSLELFAIVRF